MLAEPTRIAAPLSSSYAPPTGAYDEMKSLDGKIRPHWLKFFEHVDPMGAAELDRRWTRARHLLHENGVSYNVITSYSIHYTKLYESSPRLARATYRPDLQRSKS